MKRTILVVAAATLSTGALAQVGTDPTDQKVPATQLPAAPTPPTSAASPATDDAPPSARADAPSATATPAPSPTATPSPAAVPGDPTNASGPPPKG